LGLCDLARRWVDAGHAVAPLLELGCVPAVTTAQVEPAHRPALAGSRQVHQHRVDLTCEEPAADVLGNIVRVAGGERVEVHLLALRAATHEPRERTAKGDGERDAECQRIPVGPDA
jgi:hypothetical protein